MQIKTKAIKNSIGKLILFIAKHGFLACLFSFFLSLLFGGFLVYKYSILTERVKIEQIDQTFLIKEQGYQEILKIWQEQEQKFQEADLKEYADSFAKPFLAPEEP